MYKLKSLIGKNVVIGLNLLDNEGTLRGTNQVHGRIIRASRAEGIVVFLEEDQQEFRLPPQPSALQPAPPGQYREKRSGAVIENPDFLTVWDIITDPNVKGNGSSWKAGAKLKIQKKSKLK
jgi:hypothetical protein